MATLSTAAEAGFARPPSVDPEVWLGLAPHDQKQVFRTYIHRLSDQRSDQRSPAPMNPALVAGLAFIAGVIVCLMISRRLDKYDWPK